MSLIMECIERKRAAVEHKKAVKEERKLQMATLSTFPQQQNAQLQATGNALSGLGGSGLASATVTTSKMEIEDQGIKDHIDEKFEELKKVLTREADSNDKIQDLTDLIMVVLDEIKHIKQTIKDEIQQHQPQPQIYNPPPQPVPQTPGGNIGSWSGTAMGTTETNA